MQTVGERIKQQRKRLKASQSDLAKAIGVSQASITYWENDANEPAGGNLLALARALHVTPQWILTGRRFIPACAGNGLAPRGLFHA